jgi:hypothetical protein
MHEMSNMGAQAKFETFIDDLLLPAMAEAAKVPLLHI